MLKKKITKKKYVPNSKEKYMCVKHKKYFTEELIKWKKEISRKCSLSGTKRNFRRYQVFRPNKIPNNETI